jgi:endonuclease-3
MKAKVDWAKAVRPLIKKYKGKKHPLEYKNLYQLVVMVVLSARTTDLIVNAIAPKLFSEVPDFRAMGNLTPELLHPYISKIAGFRKKAEWLIRLAKTVSDAKKLPLTMDELTKLPGIGRKSASVILREAGKPAEGIIVDLHVVRVAPRLGIAKGDDPRKIEEQIMKKIPQQDWGIGMDISFLGREICRPTNPKCTQCPMNPVCAYFKGISGKK